MGASDDGSKAYFDSRRPLTDDDDDDKVDLYRYENGTLTLISADPSPFDPEDAEDAFAAPEPLDRGDLLSEDGSRIYFSSTQSMSPDDTDCGRMDFYEHSDTGNRLVTVRAVSPTIAPGPCAFDTAMPTFDLAAANPGDGLECRIDQEDWEACSSTFTPEINDGDHVLYVRGIPRRVRNPASRTADSPSRRRIRRTRQSPTARSTAGTSSSPTSTGDPRSSSSPRSRPATSNAASMTIRSSSVINPARRSANSARTARMIRCPSAHTPSTSVRSTATETRT